MGCLFFDVFFCIRIDAYCDLFLVLLCIWVLDAFAEIVVILHSHLLKRGVHGEAFIPHSDPGALMVILRGTCRFSSGRFSFLRMISILDGFDQS